MIKQLFWKNGHFNISGYRVLGTDWTIENEFDVQKPSKYMVS